MRMKKFSLITLLCTTLIGFSAKANAINKGIVGVKSYGFIDLEGAKLSAIIVEYDQEVKASSVRLNKYEITNYTLMQEKQWGYDKVIETDKDGIKGNEGQPTRIYVNNRPAPSTNGGTKQGKYVIIEVNTNYILCAQNLVYQTSMIAGVKQTKPIKTVHGTIAPGTEEVKNYTTQQLNKRDGRKETAYLANTNDIILPEFGADSGWTIHRIGKGAFAAKHCYSEYTGEYYDFELPYAIYVPKKAVLEANKGNIALTIHMEHAGANSTDPMAAITSSRASVIHASKEMQATHPTIVIVPQIEEERRTTNDLVASSEANAAIWQLIDAVLAEYKDYIDEQRIYGTGQSMGGMCILNMAAQRDNFFAGVVVTGAQWSNNYDKTFQNGGNRTPDNDPTSFNGFGLDRMNFQNWYYMISDDNILVQTCADDPMATGEWQAVVDYYEAQGVRIPQAAWSPFIPIEEQDEKGRQLLHHTTDAAGNGITWAQFNQGSHMSTWKYGYQVTYPFEWLYSQTRETELRRPKIEGLKNPWLGRNKDGKVLQGSGTAQLNSTQFTPSGADTIFYEGWTPVTATIRMIDAIPEKETEAPTTNTSGMHRKKTRAEYIDQVHTAYEKLSEVEQKQVTNYNKLQEFLSKK